MFDSDHCFVWAVRNWKEEKKLFSISSNWNITFKWSFILVKQSDFFFLHDRLIAYCWGNGVHHILVFRCFERTREPATPMRRYTSARATIPWLKLSFFTTYNYSALPCFLWQMQNWYWNTPMSTTFAPDFVNVGKNLWLCVCPCAAHCSGSHWCDHTFSLAVAGFIPPLPASPRILQHKSQSQAAYVGEIGAWKPAGQKCSGKA